MSRILVFVAVLAITGPASGREAVPWRGCFEAAARLHDVPMELLLGVAKTESHFDADARSHANAHGVMQIQWPGTARHLGVHRVSELYNPCLNIALGARYLAELIARAEGDVEVALASYNYGPGRIERTMARGEPLPQGAQQYVARVLAHRADVLEAGNGVRAAALAHAGDDLLQFRHRVRAERVAASLNAQFESARFQVVAYEGSHAVRMLVDGDALSMADALRLAALGFTEVAR